jgi:formimidoylglutamate deiminase
MRAMQYFDARWILTESGWLSDARVAVGADGLISSIEPKRAARRPAPDAASPAGIAAGPAAASSDAATAVDLLLPGMPNAHCVSFQHRLAGSAEQAGARGHGFRAWRERMYGVSGTLDAAALEAGATDLYRRLRGCGYTSVAEFHFLHRLAGEPGRRANLATAVEGVRALMRAAAAAGIGLLLMPVLHRWGGFGRAALSSRQVRFALVRDDYRRLLETLLVDAADPALNGLVRIGVAPHSLAAADGDDLRWLLELREALAPGCPIHIQMAEHAAEVADAVAHLGSTPIAWLCDQAPVDAAWTIVHATHADPSELQLLQTRGATIAVCPTTEANLGAGMFPVEDWWKAGGSLAIGSASNVGIDPTEELRWLEYQARLRRQSRAVLGDSDAPHPGTALWRRAVAGGRRAFGVDRIGLSVGAPAELLLVACEAAASPDEAMDDFVFSRRLARLTGTVTAVRTEAADSTGSVSADPGSVADPAGSAEAPDGAGVGGGPQAGKRLS